MGKQVLKWVAAALVALCQTAYASPKQNVLAYAFYGEVLQQRFSAPCAKVGVHLHEPLAASRRMREQLVELALEHLPPSEVDLVLTRARQQGESMADELARKFDPLFGTNVGARSDEAQRFLCSTELRLPALGALPPDAVRKLFENGLQMR